MNDDRNFSKKIGSTILVVDDDKGIRQMLQMILSNQDYEILQAKDGTEAIELLEEQKVNLVISDVMMPVMDGYELCNFIRKSPQFRDLYIILLTAKNEVNDRVVGLDYGADDYLGKPFATAELLARVRAAFRLIALQNELKEKNQMLHDATIRDSLTQVFNRHHFNEVISNEVSRTKRYENNLALIILDIDHFKSVNDTYGHLVGDEVLKHVARTLKEKTRENDTVARYGGEEFTVILPETNMRNASEAAEKLRSVIESSNYQLENGNQIKITISAGIASFQENECQNVNELVDKADQALLIAKRSGRNRIMISEE